MRPEIKIILYICFILFVSAVSSLKVYAVISIFFCAGILVLGVPVRRVISGWLPISIFLIFTFASNIVNQYGKVIFSVGPLLITEEGLQIASIRTLRVLLLITGAKILVALSNTEDIIKGLLRLLTPFERTGLPVNDFFQTMGLTLKCFPILKARLSDNYNQHVVKTNIRGVWNRVKAVSAFLLPLFVESINNPDHFFIEPEQGEKAN